jgi:hypothetical protein
VGDIAYSLAALKDRTFMADVPKRPGAAAPGAISVSSEAR